MNEFPPIVPLGDDVFASRMVQSRKLLELAESGILEYCTRGQGIAKGKELSRQQIS
jgi:hypothetical protein